MAGRILISACLLGQPVRYDGKGKPLVHPFIDQWKGEGRLVPLCPELAGGMSVPRPAAEIENGMTGEDVLAGRARVLELTGGDVTVAFTAGAERALAAARQNDCRFALLIDGSPSCGSQMIYDGAFSGRKIAGHGVTAALLRRNGIEIFAPSQIDDLARSL
ncbi:DUF523 domain-containing protein [Rhizobium helianthi]|uniref:DUF523 domain-containing protein n=1 Tax=Rhizobium helianthi TaxID=1132695 RepID=A0ABW4M2X9_9HYPH